MKAILWRIAVYNLYPLMNTVIKILLWVVAFVAATLVGMYSMMGLHHLSGFVFPEAAISKIPTDPVELESFMTGLGLAPKISVLLSHWGGTVMSALTAQLIAPTKKVWPGATMGVVFLIGGILNAMMIPMPNWMVVTDVLGYVPLAWLAARALQHRVNRA